MTALADGVEHRLGPVEQIPVGEGREFLVDGERVAAFRPRAGGVVATQAQCPHRGGPLADGLVGMASVICPLHQRRFSLRDGTTQDGDCALAVHSARVDEEGELVVGLTTEGRVQELSR